MDSVKTLILESLKYNWNRLAQESKTQNVVHCWHGKTADSVKFISVLWVSTVQWLPRRKKHHNNHTLFWLLQSSNHVSMRCKLKKSIVIFLFSFALSEDILAIVFNVGCVLNADWSLNSNRTNQKRRKNKTWNKVSLPWIAGRKGVFEGKTNEATLTSLACAHQSLKNANLIRKARHRGRAWLCFVRFWSKLRENLAKSRSRNTSVYCLKGDSLNCQWRFLVRFVKML